MRWARATGSRTRRPRCRLAAKQRFIELLVAAGLREIEATSFVSPRAIPQLADADALLPTLPPTGPDGPVRYPVLVANERGLARAEAAGARAMAVFTAASDAFTQANIGMSVDDSLAAFRPLVARARALGWWTRGYVSTAFGCPFIGRVDPARVVEVAGALARARGGRGLPGRHDRRRRAVAGPRPDRPGRRRRPARSTVSPTTSMTRAAPPWPTWWPGWRTA